jgi:ferritin-like metal-binding protein YciE
MSLKTLQDLFVHELHDLHSAKNQLVSELPKMAKAAKSYRLRRGLEGQLEQSRHHVQRLEQILKQVDKSARGVASDALEGTVDVLMPLYGEWIPVESSKSPCRRQSVSLDDECIAAAPGARCDAMEGLLEQSRKLIDEEAESHVKDAGLIAEAQRVEHYEIATYRTAREHARLLGHIEAEKLLEQTLAEVKLTDENLTEMAESEINNEALQAG